MSGFVVEATEDTGYRRAQIEKIKELLCETDFPLKVIADLTGFEHISYMSVMFKRHVGSWPGKYRDAKRLAAA